MIMHNWPGEGGGRGGEYLSSAYVMRVIALRCIALLSLYHRQDSFPCLIASDEQNALWHICVCVLCVCKTGHTVLFFEHPRDNFLLAHSTVGGGGRSVRGGRGADGRILSFAYDIHLNIEYALLARRNTVPD